MPHAKYEKISPIHKNVKVWVPGVEAYMTQQPFLKQTWSSI